MLLWIRGMPFSVSAGVGFIALFGIAVLNGIVLIEHLKELQHQGFTNMRELIIQGTKNRLRPVMLTAAAAAMGFLPMAISTGAGAEVQRPLATVVIGGLVTSTMLTMIALPLLFEIFYNIIGIKFFPLRFIRSKGGIIILFLLIPLLSSYGQSNELNLDAACDLTIKNNPEIAAFKLKIEEQKVLKRTAFSPDKTIVSYGTDQNNVAENGYPLKVWGLEQSFRFPTLYMAEGKARQIEVSIAEINLTIQTNELLKLVAHTYFNYQLMLNKRKIYQALDSLYTVLLSKYEKREAKGDLSRLELLNIKAKKNQVIIPLNTLEIEIQNIHKKLKNLMNYEHEFSIPSGFELLPTFNLASDSLPYLKLLEYESNYRKSLIRIEKNKSLPDFSINYFLGSNRNENAAYYHGFEIGIALPLFYGSSKAKVKAAQFSSDAQNLIIENEKCLLSNKIEQLLNEQLKYKILLDNYNLSGKILQEELMRTALKSYELGEINFYQFVNSYESAFFIHLEYFENVYQYNVASSQIMFFSK